MFTIKKDQENTEYRNAKRIAEIYAESTHKSKRAVFHFLIRESGENFTEEEAMDAVSNIDIDWKNNALQTAKGYKKHLRIPNSRIYTLLISENGEKFSKEEAQYAIDHLDD